MAIEGRSSRTRKRGVRASRVKLEKAMSDAGFKTQAALAEHIADSEKLESVPKDFVSKVFREQFVAPSSIERIASALDVEAYTLYQSSTDELVYYSDKVQTTDVDTHSEHVLPSFSHTSKRFPLVWAAAPVAILLVIVFWTWFQTVGSSIDNESRSVDIGNISIAVPDFPSSELRVFSDSLRRLITGRYQTPTPAALAIGYSTSPWKTIDNLNVDFVLEGDVYRFGHHVGLLVYLVGTESRTLLGSFSDLELVNNGKNIADFTNKIGLAINNSLTGQTEWDDQSLSKDALINYLKSLVQLDKSLTEINIRRALDLIQRVLRVAPHNTKARAAICDALVRQSIVNGDKSLLVDAENECAQAGAERSNVPELQYSLAQLKRKQGKTDEAIELYKKVTLEYPMFVSAQLGLAEALINKVQQTGDQSYFNEALQVTALAEQYQPDFWKTPFIVSRIYYFSGQVDKAIDELERSKRMSVNISNVANQGTMYFCQGNILKAEQNYLTLNEISGPSAINENFLGVISFAKEDYVTAVHYFESSLEKMQADGSDGLYLAWINLADAYFAKGNLSKAKDTYQHAIVLADQYRLKGENDNNIAAHIFYSNLKALLTMTSTLDENTRLNYVGQLHAIAEKTTDLDAQVRVMLSWVLLNEIEMARPIFDNFASTCRGYASYPILKQYFG